MLCSIPSQCWLTSYTCKWNRSTMKHMNQINSSLATWMSLAERNSATLPHQMRPKLPLRKPTCIPTLPCLRIVRGLELLRRLLGHVPPLGSHLGHHGGARRLVRLAHRLWHHVCVGGLHHGLRPLLLLRHVTVWWVPLGHGGLKQTSSNTRLGRVIIPEKYLIVYTYFSGWLFFYRHSRMFLLQEEISNGRTEVS